MVTPNQAKNKWADNTEGSRFSSGVSEAGASAYDDGVSNASNEDYNSGVERFLNGEGGPGGSVTVDYDWKAGASGKGSTWQSNTSAAADKYEQNTGSDESDRWLSEYARAYQE